MSNAKDDRLPRSVVVAITVISALPYLLMRLGLDIGNSSISLDPSDFAGLAPNALLETCYQLMSGSFTHTILEWTAVCVAMMTVVLGFIHFSIRGDVTTPILCIALLCSGVMDAFHTLAADRLITAVAPNEDLIPFTWALCRLYNSIILLVGTGIFLVLSPTKWKHRTLTIAGISSVFAFVAYVTIAICATSQRLPQTMFPDSILTRPYDFIPLVLYVIAGIVVLPKFFLKSRTLFAHSLLVSVIPNIATQLYMVAGSSTLFDSGFNAGHSMKIVSYLVPLLGLILDYKRTNLSLLQSNAEISAQAEQLRKADARLHEQNKSLEARNLQLQESREDLERKVQELSQANRELDSFAFAASHDLQEPMRNLVAYSGLLQEDLGEELNDDARQDLDYIMQSTRRMQVLIEDLLALSKTSRGEILVKPVALDSCLDDVLQTLHRQISEKGVSISRGKLPTVQGDATLLTQVFQNLISNAIKFSNSESPQIAITAEKNGDIWTIGVKDNGIGIERTYREQIFSPFTRLHGRDEFPGTGIGLALCRRAIERHGGSIWVDAEPGKGSHFQFSLPQ